MRTKLSIFLALVLYAASLGAQNTSGTLRANFELLRQQHKWRGDQRDHTDDVETIHKGEQVCLSAKLVVVVGVRSVQCVRVRACEKP
jgi:hypothetical protein